VRADIGRVDTANPPMFCPPRTIKTCALPRLGAETRGARV
jgi:hypothetical protein